MTMMMKMMCDELSSWDVVVYYYPPVLVLAGKGKEVYHGVVRFTWQTLYCSLFQQEVAVL